MSTEDVACRTCRMRLGVHEHGRGGLVTYLHAVLPAGVAPHEPDPAPVAEIPGGALSVCDFCSAWSDTWTFPTRPFVDRGTPMTNFIDFGSPDEGWAACDPCKTDIDAGNWGRVADRAVANVHADEPIHEQRRHRAEVMRLHQVVAANMIGEPFREYESRDTLTRSTRQDKTDQGGNHAEP